MVCQTLKDLLHTYQIPPKKSWLSFADNEIFFSNWEQIKK